MSNDMRTARQVARDEYETAYAAYASSLGRVAAPDYESVRDAAKDRLDAAKAHPDMATPAEMIAESEARARFRQEWIDKLTIGELRGMQLRGVLGR